MTSNWRKFYAFESVKSAAAAAAAAASEMLNLKIKSVNFNVNVFTAFSEDISGCPLSLSISDSIINSPSLVINLSDLSGYENVFIHVGDSVIQSGRFMFKNKRESCKPKEHIANIVEINNILVSNIGVMVLNVNGCFDLSLNNLTYGNLTWKKQELFKFRGSSIKMKNILIENVLPDNNKLEGKALFFIQWCTLEIQNVLIKGCKVPSNIWLNKTIALFLIKNSLVKMSNLKVIRNFLQIFARVENSFLHIRNISLSRNIFTGTLCTIEKSNLTVYDADFHSNKIGSLIHMNRNVFNKIYKNGYPVGKSMILLNNVALKKNNVRKDMLYLASSSTTTIQNNTLTENIVSKAVYNISGMSKIQLNNAVFTQNNMRDLLEMQSHSSAIIQNNTFIENNMSRIVYLLFSMSNIHLNNVVFTRNNMPNLLQIQSNSSAIVQNNTLTENKLSRIVYLLFSMSNIHLNNVVFTRNNMPKLLQIQSNSSAIIQNNTFIENNMSRVVYLLFIMSNIHLNNVVFTRNNMPNLLQMQSNSSAIIQNNTFIENNMSGIVYLLFSMSNIHLNNVVFTRNNMRDLLQIQSNSSAIIQNNTFIENNMSRIVYLLFIMSNIHLNNVVFTRNNMPNLLQIQSNSSAIVQNNTLTENKMSRIVYLLLSMSNIRLNNVVFIRNNMSKLLQIQSNSSAIIQNNTLSENNISGTVYLLARMSNIQLNNVVFTRNNITGSLLLMFSISNAKVNNFTITGNNIDGSVFDINASNIGTDKILLYNNTFKSNLISAIFSYNVSFNLMTIRENRCQRGIIHIENCRGRLTNFSFQNYDRFSVSAISVTCRYNENCSFYIVNSKILWNYELLISARPIIELTGTINISNLTILVSSITKIEVLRYSNTSSDIQRLTPIFKGHVYEISSLLINCKRANVKHIAALDSFICIPCARHTYTLNNGLLKLSSRFFENKTHKFQSENSYLSCFDCPVGGDCSEYIKSKSNFYGFKTKQRKVKFLPCPLNFCCNADQCKTINSCNRGRSGTLCGMCSGNNTESFLSGNCISKKTCQNFVKF